MVFMIFNMVLGYSRNKRDDVYIIRVALRDVKEIAACIRCS